MTFERIWVGEIELSGPPQPDPVAADLADYRRARILVRLHRLPLGFVDVLLDGPVLSRETVVGAARARLSDAWHGHLLEDGLTEHEAASVASCPRWPALPDGRISVVVATLERPVLLAACLDGLERLRYRPAEILVVDNAPRTGATRELVELRRETDQRIRYLVEPRTNMSRAQNLGAREAFGEIVAFTDDDVVVDPWWLDGLARGFARDPRIACVTGIVPSAQLESVAQLHFDQRVSWAENCHPCLHGLDDHRHSSPLWPYAAGLLGTGANCAFKRDFFLRMGGFDELLGPGTPTLAGPDIDAFVRTILEGRMLAYEPAAIVWHFHRRTTRDLKRQMYAYGTGLTAFATKHLVNRRTTLQILRRVPHGLAHALRLWRRGEGTPGLKRRMAAIELAGMAAGPLAYLASRCQAARQRTEVG